MRKILFLPFLQIPTGHHQVADALAHSLQKRLLATSLKKVDFLSYIDERIERIVTSTYLKWIGYSPQTYDWVYRSFLYSASRPKRSLQSKSLLQNKMLMLLEEEHPDLVVCTQAYPSYIIDTLKEQGKLTIPVINVYTDFFINRIWGLKAIDYHFVPDSTLKNYLFNYLQIPREKIVVTGIPIDERFTFSPRTKLKGPPYRILISGGNGGMGNILNLLATLNGAPRFNYLVLCGYNYKLFEQITALKRGDLFPLSYISSREEMNSLYDRVDAIITKPGGVTISEALYKKLPIFVHYALPGQEEINLKYLKANGFVHELNSQSSVEEQLWDVLNDQARLSRWDKRVEDYRLHLEKPAWQKICELSETVGRNYW